MSNRNHRATDHRLDDAAEICAKRGAKLTELRRLVLHLILDAEAPPTAYQLLDRMREARKGAVPPTVYRALDFLVEQGLVHKLERLNAFVPCIDADHRDHAAQFLICKKCGTVTEIEDGPTSMALKRAAETQGFQTESAIVELVGLCAACAPTAAEHRAAS
jgi:Fur family transcriptional regulator, zinc uptake regulator